MAKLRTDWINLWEGTKLEQIVAAIIGVVAATVALIFTLHGSGLAPFVGANGSLQFAIIKLLRPGWWRIGLSLAAPLITSGVLVLYGAFHEFTQQGWLPAFIGTLGALLGVVVGDLIAIHKAKQPPLPANADMPTANEPSII